MEAECDSHRFGGGWTLLTKSSSSQGWTNENILKRNSDNPQSEEYSIFSLVDHLKGSDKGEVIS